MARAPRICRHPGCPELVTSGYCDDHEREHGRRRANANARGYGHAHQKLRAILAQQVALGEADCHFCGQPIRPGESWHLDHTEDRTAYRGAAHARCNTSDGGRRAHTSR